MNNIRKATIQDLDEIMIIIKEIQKEMKENHNPQWNEEDDYPSRTKFLSDIKSNALYAYDDSRIKGLMAITDDKKDYDDLLKTTELPAYVLHRLAIKSEFRKNGIASLFFNYAEKLARENGIVLLKGDTEIHNDKMNHLFLKLGFVKKGEFEYDDYPGHYIYYEKEIK